MERLFASSVEWQWRYRVGRLLYKTMRIALIPTWSYTSRLVPPRWLEVQKRKPISSPSCNTVQCGRWRTWSGRGIGIGHLCEQKWLVSGCANSVRHCFSAYLCRQCFDPCPRRWCTEDCTCAPSCHCTGPSIWNCPPRAPPVPCSTLVLRWDRFGRSSTWCFPPLLWSSVTCSVNLCSIMLPVKTYLKFHARTGLEIFRIHSPANKCDEFNYLSIICAMIVIWFLTFGNSLELCILRKLHFVTLCGSNRCRLV